MALTHVPRPGAILLVEDCDDVRLGVAQLLELNGFRVSDVGRRRACDRSSSTPNPTGFALILLDLLLPGSISGGDVRARQLADPSSPGVPTVVVSACEPEDEAQAKLTPDVWLEKPFRGEKLLEVVRDSSSRLGVRRRISLSQTVPAFGIPRRTGRRYAPLTAGGFHETSSRPGRADRCVGCCAARGPCISPPRRHRDRSCRSPTRCCRSRIRRTG